MIGKSPSDFSKGWKPAARTLIVGVNWIGDTIMSMPAVQAWRRANPEAHLSVLVKKGLAPLWELHASPDSILTFEESPAGTFAAGKMLKSGRFDRAVLFPNSFRSALIPFLGGIKEVVATPGHHRRILLTRSVAPRAALSFDHQAYEYFDLLGLDAPEQIEPPRLQISEGARERAHGQLENLPRPVIGLIPGAARGPSKRWPAEHFISAGKHFAAEKNAGVVLFGGPDDSELCDQVCEGIGENAISMAGRTSLKEWAALLACCDLVVCNDSGGMHLAAAVGAPVVAIFGVTDPSKTGPVGGCCSIIRDESAAVSRDVARDSEAARKALAGISPERVIAAADGLLAKAVKS